VDRIRRDDHRSVYHSGAARYRRDRRGIRSYGNDAMSRLEADPAFLSWESRWLHPEHMDDDYESEPEQRAIQEQREINEEIKAEDMYYERIRGNHEY